MKITVLSLLALLSLVTSPFCMAQTQDLSSVFLEELTWTEVEAFVKNGGTSIIIPTGGTEQNGPHMALGKHNFRVKYMADKIARTLGKTLVAPTIAYVPEGDINPPQAHMNYAGTISIPHEVFIKVLEYTCRSFKQHGFLNIYLIGDSGGNQYGMEVVSEILNKEWQDTNVRVHFISDYYNPPQTQITETLIKSGFTPEELGFHGGVVDTSYLYAIDSTMIRTDKLLYSELSNEEKSKKWGYTGDLTKVQMDIGKQRIDMTLEATLSQIKSLQMENKE